MISFKGDTMSASQGITHVKLIYYGVVGSMSNEIPEVLLRRQQWIRARASKKMGDVRAEVA